MDAFGALPRDRVVVLLTGSQGEPRAALARMAEEEHPEISLDPGDILVFSSRTIPGNERAVNRIINAMVRRGIEVVTDRNKLVHVSGHPRRGELALMYEWLKPQVAVPVHGEALHLHENAALARSLGVPQVVTCYNGDVVRLAPAPAEKIDDVPFGRLFRDGNLLVEEAERGMAERRRLAFAGVVSVALALGGRGELAGDPVVELAGLPLAAGGESMEQIVIDAVIDAFGSLPKGRRRDPDALSEAIQRSVRGKVGAVWGKKPACHVLVIQA
jgi:ribonuclease J